MVDRPGATFARIVVGCLTLRYRVLISNLRSRHATRKKFCFKGRSNEIVDSYHHFKNDLLLK